MRGLRAISIRIKLAVLCGGIVAAVALGQAFQSLAKESLALQEDVAMRARVALVSTAGALGSQWTPGEPPPGLEPYATRLAGQLDILGVALLDARGGVLAYTGERPDDALVARTLRLHLRAMPRSLVAIVSRPLELQIATPVLFGTEVRGYLLCVFRSSVPAERLQNLVVESAFSALLWVALGGGLTLWVTQRLTRPLMRLADALTGMEEHDYLSPPYQLPAEGTGEGEIGLVQERLAQLSLGLVSERHRVTELTDALRHQIEVVSRDLEATSEQRGAILDSVRDGILVVDGAGVVVAANDPARHLFGDELVGHRLEERVADLEALRSVLHQAAGLQRPALTHLESRPAPGQNGRALRLRATPLAAEGGSQVVVAEDVSESVALEEQLRRSRRLQALATLTAGLSHQIGNHLGSIRGYATLLGRRPSIDAAMRADLEAISREVRSANDLMERVHLLARTRPLAMLPVELEPVAREATAMVQLAADAAQVRLVHVTGPEAWVAGDAQLLLQALLNLLHNAIQATAPGGEVSLSVARPGGGRCVFEVKDSGCGMAAEVRAKIFDPFFTTKPEGKGSGLGLAIVLRIVELHGGVVAVDSAAGRGTLVRLELPGTPGPEIAHEVRHGA